MRGVVFDWAHLRSSSISSLFLFRILIVTVAENACSDLCVVAACTRHERPLLDSTGGTIPFVESKTVVMRNYYIGPLHSNLSLIMTEISI